MIHKQLRKVVTSGQGKVDPRWRGRGGKQAISLYILYKLWFLNCLIYSKKFHLKWKNSSASYVTTALCQRQLWEQSVYYFRFVFPATTTDIHPTHPPLVFHPAVLSLTSCSGELLCESSGHNLNISLQEVPRTHTLWQAWYFDLQQPPMWHKKLGFYLSITAQMDTSERWWQHSPLPCLPNPVFIFLYQSSVSLVMLN